MVLTQPHSILDGDLSPLALLRLRRDEADKELRKSLINASFMALTLVVAFMLGQIVLRADAPRVILVDYTDLPQPPPHKPRPYVPGTTEYHPPIPNTAPNGFTPSDDLANDAKPVVDPVPAIPTDGVTDGNATLLPPGTGRTGVGEDLGIPDPKEYVYRDVEPQAVTKVIPQYPSIARDAGMEGSVIVRLLVGLDGRVQRAEIEESSAMFDDAALAAGRQWIFTPALANDHPVRVWVRVPMKFTLH